MDKKKTWDERLLDAMISTFFFGLVVTVADLMGVDLNWETGVGVMILSVLAFILTVIIGSIVYAVRMRRKANG